jgi:hypothetical protein
MSRIVRDWSEAIEKVNREGRCRYCGERPPFILLQAAHILDRSYDQETRRTPKAVHRKVLGVSVVPLCQADHELYDGSQLDLSAFLNPDEWAWAIMRVGLGQAQRRIMGRGAWMGADG